MTPSLAICAQRRQFDRLRLGAGLEADAPQRGLAREAAEPELLAVQVEAHGEHLLAADQALEAPRRVARQVQALGRGRGDQLGIRRPRALGSIEATTILTRGAWQHAVRDRRNGFLSASSRAACSGVAELDYVLRAGKITNL